MRKWGNMWGIATRRISVPLSHQFSNRFIHCRIHPQMTVKYALWAVHNSPFSIVFSHTYSTLYKIYLNSGQWRVNIGYFCLIISWRISRWHLDIRKNVKKISKYLVYLLNSKTTCDCLTWMFLCKELCKPWKWFTADLSFLGCFFLLATAARN